MKITKEWLQEQGACAEGTKWFLGQRASRLDTCVMKLLKEDRFDWANWTITRLMSHTQKVTYAAFAAKQVLHIFEEKYPNDKRPREAIEAALRFAERPTPENRDAANAAANAAYAAANAAYAAYANAAAYAANAAANAANAAANAAYAAYANAAANAAAYAANAAANAAAYAAYANAARAGMKRKIVVYGLKLLAKGA